MALRQRHLLRLLPTLRQQRQQQQQKKQQQQLLSSMSEEGEGGGPVEATIKQKLDRAFKPSHLQVLNESFMHNVPRGSETHFKVLVVSEGFQGKKLIERHRLVNDCLSSELSSGVHALSVVAKTPQQWEEQGKKPLEQSPKCRGGFGK